MKIEFDPVKRAWTLQHRYVDFLDAEEVLTGPRFTFEDRRKAYDEVRNVTLGYLRGRLMVVVWTKRIRNDDTIHHVISMRKANAREKARFENELRET